MQRKKAEARRAAISKAVDGFGLAALHQRSGFITALASAFGVHRTTIWRDLQQILCLLPETNFVDSEGNLLYTVTRAYKGGRILSIEDAEGREIRGPRRRQIIRQVRRWDRVYREKVTAST